MRLTLTPDNADEHPDELLRVLYALGTTLDASLEHPEVTENQVSVTIRVAPAVGPGR